MTNPHRKSSVACVLLVFAAALTAQTPDLVVSHATIVTMDSQRRILEDASIAITGDSITEISLSPVLTGRKLIDAHGAIVMPGLINAHTHVPMSFFRGLAEDRSLNDWLQKFIFPAEARNVTPDFVTWATRLSLLEMIRGGTTTIADMYYFEDEIAQTLKEAGMRGILGETIIGFPAPDNKTSDAALGYTEKFLQRWQHDPLIIPAVAPHSIYTCGEKLLKDSAALARAYHAPLLMHIAEAPYERDVARTEHASSTVQYLARIGLLGPDLTGAHCVWVDQADIQTLAHFGVGCSYNPSSNMKSAAGLMPASEMLAAGVAVGIGSDGAASNNNQDMFREMDIAAKLQKFSRMDPTAMPAKQTVEMATITGARALHLEKITGSLEVGKRADFIIVDTDAAHATPLYDVYAQLVYAIKDLDVRTTVINGRIVMEDRKFMTLDEPSILKKAAEYKTKVAASLRIPATNAH